MKEFKCLLGKRVRHLREDLNLSREKFCEIIEISDRQLKRIESGESSPTLETMNKIAQGLKRPISYFVDEERLKLPLKYLELKDRLIRLPTYESPNRISAFAMSLEEIYLKYYDNLPEEEQLCISIVRSIKDVHFEKKISFGQDILEEYFAGVMKKKTFSLNDLLILRLYFNSAFFSPLKDSNYENILKRLYLQSESASGLDAAVILRIFIDAIGMFTEYEEYQLLNEPIQYSNRLMEKIEDFHQKPIIEMIEGKYWLFVKGDVEKAKDKYKVGSLLASMHKSEFLAQKISEEWEQDLKKLKHILPSSRYT